MGCQMPLSDVRFVVQSAMSVGGCIVQTCPRNVAQQVAHALVATMLAACWAVAVPQQSSKSLGR